MKGFMMFDKNLFGEEMEPEKQGSILADSWEYPPFSVLNAREGWWQERKRQWLALGIQSELGRGEDGLTWGTSAQITAKGLNYYRDQKKALTFRGAQAPEDLAGAEKEKRGGGTSIFDPVLCELAYRWFAPKFGSILDPFAGGSVRGVVASHLGMKYHGVDLREEQIIANQQQAHLCTAPVPEWKTGDSREICEIYQGQEADFVFSCPPYADLEVYSDNPKDLSSMAYDEFRNAYADIISEACSMLKDDRFACFVVGEARDKKGNYYNLVGDTISAFKDAGLHYYNEAILVTSVGSLPVRVNGQFRASRKIGKTHQNVLVFVKGDGKRATANIKASENLA